MFDAMFGAMFDAMIDAMFDAMFDARFDAMFDAMFEDILKHCDVGRRSKPRSSIALNYSSYARAVTFSTLIIFFHLHMN